GRLYVGTVPALVPRLELVPLGGDRFRARPASGSHIAFGRDVEGRRTLTVGGAYFVEEPRWRTLFFTLAPPIVVWILATGVLLPLAVFRRRTRPGPGFGWPLAASLCFFAMPRLFFDLPFVRLGELNLHTFGIFVFSIGFAVASIGSAVQA